MNRTPENGMERGGSPSVARLEIGQLLLNQLFAEARAASWGVDRDAFAATRDPGLGLRDDVGRGGNLVHEVHCFRRFRPDLLALEKHLQRVAGLHETGDTLRPAGAREQADLDSIGLMRSRIGAIA